MATRNDRPPTSNPITLARRLVSGGVALAKLEVRRGRQEMAQNLGQLRGGVILIALAAAVVVAFVVALIAFIIALLVAGGFWWVALIVLVAMLLLRRPAGLDRLQAGAETRSSPRKRRSHRSRRTSRGPRPAC